MAEQIAKDLKGLSTPIKDLKPADRNARKGDVDAIRKSYERFGQRKPIVAHRQTKKIIAGNHQYQAAMALGWENIAVVFVDDDVETATAYSIADNRIGQLGEWDVQELVAAFEEISADDLETVGFNDIDVEDFRALLDEHMMTVTAVPDQGGDLGERKTKKDGNPDTQVEKTSTYEEFLERYVNRAVRGILLYYTNDEYGKMIEDLDTLSKQMGTADNAETVQILVQERIKNG